MNSDTETDSGYDIGVEESASESQTPQDEAALSRITLPGFHLPYDYNSGKGSTLFPSGLRLGITAGVLESKPVMTLRELAMLELMNQWTDDPDWHKGLSDQATLNVWHGKATTEGIQGIKFSEQMFEYCTNELRRKAQTYRQFPVVQVFDADVVKSDAIVPPDLKNTLKDGSKTLEDDYDTAHPSDNKGTRETVDPWLYPLVYGRSRILPNYLTSLDNCIDCWINDAVTLDRITDFKVPRSQMQFYPFSDKFQWLPCKVDILRSAKITSYINNLHPKKYKQLYRDIERVIECALPLWSSALNPLKNPSRPPNRVIYTKVQYHRPEGGPKPKRELNENFYVFQERMDKWIERRKQLRRLVQPEPEPYIPSSSTLYVEQETLAARAFRWSSDSLLFFSPPSSPNTLKVFGDSKDGWHVPYFRNEHICAIAIYCFDTVNITPCRISFRHQVDPHNIDGIEHAESDTTWLEQVFGCERGQPAVQCFGSIEMKEGRLLAYPNTIQTKREHFRLVDPTKSGHLKILTLCLVDPNVRIISTANIPCQRWDWWCEAARAREPQLSFEERYALDGGFDYPIPSKEGNETRGEALRKWQTFVRAHTSRHFESLKL
ncbi:hypothetical protein AMATHDRAFT_5691 [Amanita thiersii Skay4041]|uniref:Uncharacterized protein n=1 Tax=Amanita thiersii Skay4041 TaxID=703135 RepID=A0A2A9ND50_9AGAR|nr:hypothetical protein AMATHDRAFT_5691 [Amanita thiersii Skay4041]